MRVAFLVFCLIVIAACGSSTEPKPGGAGDPSLLFTNNLDHDYVYITWQDGEAIIGKDSIPPRTASQCVRFLAQPDSAKWVITATQTGNGFPPATSSTGGNWFNPADRPAWSVVVNPNGAGSPIILASDVDPALAC